MTRRAAWSAAIAVIWGMFPAGAGAQPATTACAFDTSSAAYQRASVLFERGTRQLADGLFQRAVEDYRAALAESAHPYIHFNLALALLELDRSIEAHASLVEATRCGPDVLGPDKYERATGLLKLLGNSLAQVAVQCRVEGARVTLDGAELLVCPGRVQRLLEAGPHQLVASKPGWEPRVRKVSLAPGTDKTTPLPIDPVAPLVEPSPRRRWARWKPWAVVGAGAAVALAGGGLQVLAGREFDEFDAGLAGLACAQPGVADDALFGSGCRPGSGGLSAELEDMQRSATRKQRLALVGYAVGGAAAAAGIALVIANQPRVRRADSARERLVVLPVVAGDHVGVTARVQF